MWNPLILVAFASFVLGDAQQIPLESQDSTKAQDVSPSDRLPFSTAELEEYIGDVMDRWHAPGMAVAVINGEETWAKVGPRYCI